MKQPNSLTRQKNLKARDYTVDTLEATVAKAWHTTTENDYSKEKKKKILKLKQYGKFLHEWLPLELHARFCAVDELKTAKSIRERINNRETNNLVFQAKIRQSSSRIGKFDMLRIHKVLESSINSFGLIAGKPMTFGSALTWGLRSSNVENSSNRIKSATLEVKCKWSVFGIQWSGIN